jgi:hypothetical protein
MDSKSVNERDVARGAQKAKTQIDKKIPGKKLKHDPMNQDCVMM